jgi:adenylate cyclase
MAKSLKNDQTILFSDIADSTRLYEQLGDSRARKVIAAGIELMAKVVKSAHGRVIKTIGDAVMCRFDTPDSAAQAAIRMQETISADAELSTHHIQLRIGLHHGSVIEESNDLFGDAVNVAARMVSQAKAGQIVTTRPCLNKMSSNSSSSARLIDQARIKGKQALIEIFELSWGQPEELTMVGISALDLSCDTLAENVFLILDLENKHICINHEQPIITLGRDASNQIVINNPKVSRLHARIEMRRPNKFIFVDQSTNGTFILPHGGQMIHLRRDEMPLEGEGLINLGREVTPDAPTVIRYCALM